MKKKYICIILAIILALLVIFLSALILKDYLAVGSRPTKHFFVANDYAKVTKYTVYGTHLNIEGKISNLDEAINSDRFDFKLVYRSGKKSGKPDLLSRRSDHLFTNFNSVPKRCLKISNKFDDSLTNCILSSLNSDDLFCQIKSYLNDSHFSSFSPPIKNHKYRNYILK